MVSENVCKCRIFLWSVKGRQINACCGKCGVSWCKDGEWAVCLQCAHEIGLRECSYQCCVNTGGLCSSRYVECWCVCWRRQYCVNDVNDSVAGLHICRCDLRIADGYCTIGCDSESCFVAVDHCNGESVSDIRCSNGA